MLKICECWGGEVIFVLESVPTVLIDFLLLLYREETSGLGI